MLKLQRIRDFRSETRDLPKDAFLARYRNPFLVVDIVDSRRKSQDEPTVDREASKSATKRLETVDEGEPRVLVTYVVALERAEEAGSGTAVAIGRASDSDVVVYHPSVSRRHGRIEPVGTGGAYAITDLGSSYGTELDGRMLEPNRPHPLEDGSTIVLGQSVKCSFLSPGSLFDRLGEMEEG